MGVCTRMSFTLVVRWQDLRRQLEECADEVRLVLGERCRE